MLLFKPVFLQHPMNFVFALKIPGGRKQSDIWNAINKVMPI
jgi:hypothetical protein